MRQYLCSVRLGDNAQHIVANKLVTIPEIAVLKRVHGDTAVTDIRPPVDPALRAIDRSDADERERLRVIYDAAMPGAEPVIDRIFGPLAPLPATLRDIGVDPATAAAEMRRQAEALAAAAATLDDDTDDEPPVEDEDAFFDEPEPVAVAGKKAA